MSRTAIKRELGALGVSLCMLLVGAASDQTQTLTFEERVAAERAILAVYHSHQVGSNRSLDEVATRELLEKRVRTYLKQSVALETVWSTPVTPAMLEAESARIAREGRLPERLREIYAALGDDPLVILECFVRPSLVSRLARTFFASDERFGGTAQRNDWDTWWEQEKASFDESLVRPIGPEQARLTAPGSESDRFDSSCAMDDVWENGSLATLPEWRRGPAVWTGSLVLFWSYQETVLRYDPLTDTWTKSTANNYPSARLRHTAVWAGNVMIVWGGDSGLYFNTGGRYDPVSDTWTPTSSVNAPSPRSGHTAVWSGTRMIVWGGSNIAGGSSQPLGDGGQYDPVSDTWTPTSTQNAPSPRGGHSAVWTGSRMIVFGGRDSLQALSTGGQYDPVTDTWRPTSTVGADWRSLHSAVWTGSRMVVWGGVAAGGVIYGSSSGARYDPLSDTWARTSTLNAPEARRAHEALWTGKVMLIWGGGSIGPELSSGGRYDPVSDTWAPITELNAPEPRERHGMVWSGLRMVVFGGVTEFQSHELSNGARYDPDTDSWTGMSSTANRPSERVAFTMIWTGNQIVLWGGCFGYPLATGGRYDPVTDSWTQTSMINAPLGRCYHSAVWTGNRMLVWGGFRARQAPTGVLATGGQYDPISDSWEPMTDDGAPGARARHAAVWSGDRMIVWGGSADPRLGSSLMMLNSGGRYDPATDTWEPTSLADAPTARIRQTAVWADDRMIVWGGDAGSFTPLGTGGRYDPVADSWEPVSMDAAPSPRVAHTAVWAGDRMVVWGGGIASGYAVGSGGRYDPVTDTWQETTLTGAPTPRFAHASVWTGKHMLIWGGGSGTQLLNTGGRYDPVADNWEPTSTIGAPSFGGSPSVWTGEMMITLLSPQTGGGRYFLVESPDADGDGFTVCAGDCDDADPLSHPGADELCDGDDNDCDESLPSDELDADGDGYRTCAGDCDDGDPTVSPAGVELPGNLEDENCDQVLVCNPGDDWKTQGQFVKCVARECELLVASGLATPQQCAALVSRAARLRPR